MITFNFLRLNDGRYWEILKGNHSQDYKEYRLNWLYGTPKTAQKSEYLIKRGLNYMIQAQSVNSILIGTSPHMIICDEVDQLPGSIDLSDIVRGGPPNAL